MPPPLTSSHGATFPLDDPAAMKAQLGLPVDLDHIVSGAQTGGDAVSLVTGTVSTGLDRLGSLTNRGGVIERSDPSSYLVTPQTPPVVLVHALDDGVASANSRLYSPCVRSTFNC